VVDQQLVFFSGANPHYKRTRLLMIKHIPNHRLDLKTSAVSERPKMEKGKKHRPEWEAVKDTVFDLYIHHDMSLPNVIRAMNLQGFNKT
jgi:hypothetical protein